MPSRANRRTNGAEGAQMQHRLHVEAPPLFDLGLAVSSYGFFMLPPNQWVKAASGSRAGFRRPLRLSNGDSVTAMVTQGETRDRRVLDIAVETATELSEADGTTLKDQVVRMLRMRPGDIDQVEAFQSMHEDAKLDNFGHMFRSPSLWEDMVKTITLCNCGWGRTISMNAALCTEIGGGAFPTPQQVLEAGVDALQSRCGVGYRAKTICSLAQQVLDGAVASLEAEVGSLSAAELYKRLLPLAGMGPFTAANVLQLLGHFERIAADSETLRHLKQFHRPPGLTPKNVQEVAQKVYERYHPYQYLAYWYEMRRTYEDLFGCLTDMEPQDYARATGHIMRKCPAGVVRPLTSPAAKPSEALKDAVTATPGSISNEPLLEASPGAEAPDQAGASAPGRASTAPAQRGLNGANQEQQAAGRRRTKRKPDRTETDAPDQAGASIAPALESTDVAAEDVDRQAAGRRRSKRKARRAEIDAALQTLADVQAEAGGSVAAISEASPASPSQAAMKHEVQQRLKGAPAVQSVGQKQNRKVVRGAKQLQPVTQKGKRRARDGQSDLKDEHGERMCAPVTPQPPPRLRRAIGAETVATESFGM